MLYIKVILFLFLTFQLWAQQPASSGLNADERYSFVGMTLAEVIERFGAPDTVAAVRGDELWQDDVVFRYAEGDFYIYGDRVWQVRLASIQGVSAGERKAAVLLILGDRAQDMGGYLLLPITGGNWPLMLRINFNDSDRVSAIYLYRPDY